MAYADLFGHDKLLHKSIALPVAIEISSANAIRQATALGPPSIKRWFDEHKIGKRKITKVFHDGWLVAELAKPQQWSKSLAIQLGLRKLSRQPPIPQPVLRQPLTPLYTGCYGLLAKIFYQKLNDL